MSSRPHGAIVVGRGRGCCAWPAHLRHEVQRRMASCYNARQGGWLRTCLHTKSAFPPFRSQEVMPCRPHLPSFSKCEELDKRAR